MTGLCPGRAASSINCSPIRPTLVTPKNAAEGGGRIVYNVKDPTATSSRRTRRTRSSTSGEIRLTASSGKGILNTRTIRLGTARDGELRGGIFSRGTLNGGTIENPGILDAEASKRMAESFVTPKERGTCRTSAGAGVAKFNVDDTDARTPIQALTPEDFIDFNADTRSTISCRARSSSPDKRSCAGT
jgi:hypothetical protein